MVWSTFLGTSVYHERLVNSTRKYQERLPGEAAPAWKAEKGGTLYMHNYMHLTGLTAQHC